MRRREPPFIGGEEGAFGKCFIAIWKVPNQPPSIVNLGDTTIPTLGKAVNTNRPSLRPNGSLGCLLCSPGLGPW